MALLCHPFFKFSINTTARVILFFPPTNSKSQTITVRVAATAGLSPCLLPLILFTALSSLSSRYTGLLAILRTCQVCASSGPFTSAVTHIWNALCSWHAPLLLQSLLTGYLLGKAYTLNMTLNCTFQTLHFTVLLCFIVQCSMHALLSGILAPLMMY